MKAVPIHHLLALGLAILIWGGSLGPPVRAAREGLATPTVVVKAERDDLGRVALRMDYHWGVSARPGQAEILLALSFDTRFLAFDGEEATGGPGASGESLHRLERTVGPDGARRLFVLREGEDGSVLVRFRPVWAGKAELTRPFQLYLVMDSPSPTIELSEFAYPAESMELTWSTTGVGAGGMEKGEGRP